MDLAVATTLAAGTIPSATVPGHRIEGYRNSLPRMIRVLGLGEMGGKVARDLGKRALPNVEILTNSRPVGWDDVARERPAPGPGTRLNMIVIICAEGDERLFRPERGKPDMLVTFVLLRRSGILDAAGDQRLAVARRFSDLFVTTTDTDYVSELIDNLAR